jgi:hypothetical protein
MVYNIYLFFIIVNSSIGNKAVVGFHIERRTENEQDNNKNNNIIIIHLRETKITTAAS